MRTRFAVTVLVAGSVLRAGDIHAGPCLETQTSNTDNEIFNMQGGADPRQTANPAVSIWFAPFLPINCSLLPCPAPNELWATFVQDEGVWHLDGNEWNDNGKGDADDYNPNTPYSKTLNAAYLTFFGIVDDPSRSWHGAEDYASVAMANDGPYHSEYFKNVSVNTDYSGFYQRNNFSDDEVDFMCSVYDDQRGGGSNNVSARAAIAEHEGWHAWENRNFHASGVAHVVNPMSPNALIRDGITTTCFAGECDPYYPHTLETFRPFGVLNQEGFFQAPGTSWLPDAYTLNVPNPNRFHSPRQVEFEFLCDLSEPATVAPWVPMDVMMAAQAAAQDLFQRQFVNSPPMQCGDNHPMITFPPPGP